MAFIPSKMKASQISFYKYLKRSFMMPVYRLEIPRLPGTTYLNFEDVNSLKVYFLN